MSTKQLVKEIERAGWHCIRDHKHLVWGCPCGRHLLTTSKTPSDPRAVKNALSTLRRLSAQCH